MYTAARESLPTLEEAGGGRQEGGYRLIVVLPAFSSAVSSLTARATQPSLAGAFCSHGRSTCLVDELLSHNSRLAYSFSFSVTNTL